MLKIANKLKIYLYSSFIQSALAVIMMTLSLFLSYDKETDYFDNSPLYFLTNALIAVSVIVMATSLFTLPKNTLNGNAPMTLPVIYPSVLLFFTTLISGIVIFLTGTGLKMFTDLFRGFASTKILILGAELKPAMFCGILIALSSVYFLINCLPISANERFAPKHGIIGMAVPFAAIMVLVMSYFDYSSPMNVPSKFYFNIAIIAFVIFMLCELRVKINEPMPRCYFMFGMISMLTSSCASLPWLIAFFAGKVTFPIFPEYAVYGMITLAIAFYTAIRLTVYVNSRALLERISDQTPPEEENAKEAENSEVTRDE